MDEDRHQPDLVMLACPRGKPGRSSLPHPTAHLAGDVVLFHPSSRPSREGWETTVHPRVRLVQGLLQLDSRRRAVAELSSRLFLFLPSHVNVNWQCHVVPASADSLQALGIPGCCESRRGEGCGDLFPSGSAAPFSRTREWRPQGLAHLSFRSFLAMGPPCWVQERSRRQTLSSDLVTLIDAEPQTAVEKGLRLISSWTSLAVTPTVVIFRDLPIGAQIANGLSCMNPPWPSFPRKLALGHSPGRRRFSLLAWSSLSQDPPLALETEPKANRIFARLSSARERRPCRPVVRSVPRLIFDEKQNKSAAKMPAPRAGRRNGQNPWPWEPGSVFAKPRQMSSKTVQELSSSVSTTRIRGTRMPGQSFRSRLFSSASHQVFSLLSSAFLFDQSPELPVGHSQ
ncbi:hypothetical protein CMUS01_13323 [Colletotrichum musicola]|uniref:Uncharacterized protein n=1 Tax=Colletotrichum musicola TaxID=2175873 RepID=A0A8H6JDJ9_9PEZI|nr:hypothetical protein CMUS01_13323 [Colletotrichum musicola]